MKASDLLRVAILFLFLCCYCELQGQTTIWNEDFSSYPNGTITGTGTGSSPVNWNSQTGAAVNGGLIRANNTSNTGSSTLVNPLIWATNPMNISSYSNVSFTLNTGAFNVNAFENTGDNFSLEYRINGGTWVQVFSLSGSASESINPAYSVSGLSGLTLEIRATFHNTAGDENYTIDNVLVTGNLTIPNQPPVLIATGDQVYCPGTTLPIVETISITDPDDTTAFSIGLQISTGYVQGEDLLTLIGTHPSISSSWSPIEGKLTLTGPALLSEFEAAVSSVQYSSSAISPSGNRGFSITVGDANYLPATGHYYEFVAAMGITWTAARNTAALRTYYGLQGYLATLTSQEEADFSGSQALGVGWIGGSDAATEGQWLWVTGPEAGLNFWNGTAGGSSPNFAFWNTGEPNQSGNEDYAHITHPNVNPNGSWNDLSNTGAASGNYQPQGYVVEYGGMPGDPVLSITAATTIRIDNVVPSASNPLPITVYCAAGIPVPDPAIVLDESDNCDPAPEVTFIGVVSNGGSNPEILTRTYRISDVAGNTTDVYHEISVFPTDILTQPVNNSIVAGQDGVFTVSAQNADTFQWQVSTDGGTSFTAISNGSQFTGTTNNVLTILNADINQQGHLFRVLVSNSLSAGCSPSISDPAQLIIALPSVITNRRITYRVNKN